MRKTRKSPEGGLVCLLSLGCRRNFERGCLAISRTKNSCPSRRGRGPLTSTGVLLPELSLVDRLEVTNPYFNRCLKSNREKVRITTLYWCLLGYFVQCISQSPTPKLPYPQTVLPNFPPSPKNFSSKLLSYTPFQTPPSNSSSRLLPKTLLSKSSPKRFSPKSSQNSSLQSPPQNASLQTPPPNFSP